MIRNFYHSRGNKTRQRALRHGYNSGFEEKVAKQLKEYYGKKVDYETETISYKIPETNHHYTPDFILPNGIIIETKGRFTAIDRRKHILIKKQHPELDIRFVFSRLEKRISKGSKTTYKSWCIKNGFKYAEKTVPEKWLKRKGK